MKVIEALGFTALAGGLHLGAWAWMQDDGGATGAVVDVSAPVPALAGAAQSYVDLAKAWDSAPEVAPDPTAPQPITPTEARLDIPTVEAAPTPMSRPDAVDEPIVAINLPDQPRQTDLLPVPQPIAPALQAPDLQQPDPVIAALTQPVDRTSRSALAQIPEPRRAAPQIDTSTPAPDGPVARSLRPRLPQARPAPKKRAEQPRQTTQSGAKPKAQTRSASAQSPSAQAPQSSKPRASGKNSAQLTALWGAKIEQKIHRNAQNPNVAGKPVRVRMRLKVARSGKLLGVSVVRTSGYSEYDAAALRAVKRARRFPKAPQDISDAYTSFTITLGFPS